MSVPLKEESKQPLPGGTPSFLKREDWDKIISGDLPLRDFYSQNKATPDQIDEMKGFIQRGGKFEEVQGDRTEATDESANVSQDASSNEEATQDSTVLQEKTSTDEGPYVAKDGKEYPSFRAYRQVQDRINHTVQLERTKILRELEEDKSLLSSISSQRSEIKKSRSSDDDYLDPRTKVHDDILDKSLATNEEAINRRVKEQEARITQLNDELMFQALKDLQTDFDELKTTVPIKVLNDEIWNFEQLIGGPQNRERYLKDKAYRSQIEAQGISLSKDFLDNHPAYEKITKLHALKIGDPSTGKPAYPTYKSAYLEHFDSPRRRDSELAKAKLDGRNEAIEKQSSRKNKTPTLAPGIGGNGLSQPVLTRQGYQDLLSSLRGRIPTGDDRAMVDKYREALMQGKLK